MLYKTSKDENIKSVFYRTSSILAISALCCSFMFTQSAEAREKQRAKPSVEVNLGVLDKLAPVRKDPFAPAIKSATKSQSNDTRKTSSKPSGGSKVMKMPESKAGYKPSYSPVDDVFDKAKNNNKSKAKTSKKVVKKPVIHKKPEIKPVPKFTEKDLKKDKPVEVKSDVKIPKINDKVLVDKTKDIKPPKSSDLENIVKKDVSPATHPVINKIDSVKVTPPKGKIIETPEFPAPPVVEPVVEDKVKIVPDVPNIPKMPEVDVKKPKVDIDMPKIPEAPKLPHFDDSAAKIPEFPVPPAVEIEHPKVDVEVPVLPVPPVLIDDKEPEEKKASDVKITPTAPPPNIDEEFAKALGSDGGDNDVVEDKKEEKKPDVKGKAADAPDMTIKFISTETVLPLSIEPDLKELAKKVKESGERVTLISYASESADQVTSAKRVSFSRVLAVRAFLIENGVERINISVRAEGNDDLKRGAPDRVDIFLAGGRL
ncbi:MAG: hypothetical protein R3D71_08990 [Rickettsiales bacterium]